MRHVLSAGRLNLSRCPILPVTLVAASVALGAFTPTELEAQETCEDLSGIYEVMVDLPGGGPTEIELDLEQEECALTGFVGARTRTAIQNGTVQDVTASFTFQATNQGSGGMLEIQWEITVEGDDVTGTFSNDMFGSIPVLGKRVEQQEEADQGSSSQH